VIKKSIIPLWCILLAATLTGCANLRQAKLDAGNDPDKAIAEVTQIKQAAQQEQLDVLADKAYAKADEYLAEAKQGKKENQPAEAVVKNAAIAKAFFEDAKKIGEPRKANATRILEARASALSAGARGNKALIDNLADIDDDLKSETKQFSRSLAPDDFSEFQKRYLALEVKAVQRRELGGAKQAIAQAVDNYASNLAPKSLRSAQLDYAAGMNTIAQSPRTPSLYDKSVKDSLKSATQLVDVMNVIKGAPGTPENIAMQIVQQKRALGELTTNVGKLKANLQTTKHSLEEKEGALKRTEGALQQTKGVLKTQEQQLAMASTQVRFQQAMEEARKTMPQSDALV